MSEIVDRLKKLEVPPILSRSRILELLAPAILGETPDEEETYQIFAQAVLRETSSVKEIITTLRNKDLQEIIGENQITLAMVKPRLDTSLDLDAIDKIRITTFADSNLTEFLLSQIRQPLEKTVEISTLKDIDPPKAAGMNGALIWPAAQ